MKKFIVALLILVCSLPMLAETQVGSYTMAGKDKRIEAYIDKKGNLKVFIEIVGEHSKEEVSLKLDGAGNVSEFVSSLILAKAKFVEWDKVAKDNQVTDMNKAIDIKFPNCEIWWRGTKYYSSYAHDFVRLKFFVSKDGNTWVGTGGEAQHWDNKYITQKFYIIFNEPEDMQSLIDALNIDAIMKKLNEQASAGDLFK